MEKLAAQALTLLIIFVAFAMIIGGKRGARWAINLILFPIKSYAERRIAAIVFVLVAIVVLALIMLALALMFRPFMRGRY